MVLFPFHARNLALKGKFKATVPWGQGSDCRTPSRSKAVAREGMVKIEHTSKYN